MTQESNEEQSFSLRQQAEVVLQGKLVDLQSLTPEDIKDIVHELQVHQVELELQNEQLRQTQRELEATRNKFVYLYDFAPVGYITIDEQGRIWEANLTAVTKLGLERSNLVKHLLSSFVASADQNRYYFWRRKLFQGDEVQRCELRLVKKDGRQFEAQLEGNVAGDIDIPESLARVAITDITELKKAERALRESEERFRQLFEQGPIGMSILSLDHQFIRVNTYLCQMLEYREAELTQLKLEDIVHPEDLEKNRQLVNQIFRDELPQAQLEERLLTKRSETIWSRVTVALIRDEAGSPKYGLGMIENINESRQADRIVAEERHLLRTLIDNLPDYIYIKDAESRFITGNIAVAQAMGAPQVEALVGKTDADFYPQALANRFREDEIAVVESGRALINKEELLIDAEGNERVISTTKVPLRDQQGQVTGLVGIDRDVTQRKQVENERAQLFAAVSRQREELRALAARLVEVQELERQHLARELHDTIGQNLTALGFNLNFLQLQLANPSIKLELIRARLADSLTLVEQTTDRIRDVMSDLRPPMLDDYGLGDALDWYAGRFTERMQLEVTVQADPYLPRLEASVENALFRIVQEALNNVAKHAQASQVIISLNESDNKMRLVITDNGIGFDPAQQYRIPRQPSLGLLTMIERAEAVGALCRIETHPGQGTRVIVEVSQ